MRSAQMMAVALAGSLGAWLLAGAAPVALAQSGPLDALKRLDRSVCRNFESVRCKRGKAAAPRASKKRKAAPAAPQVDEAAVDAATTDVPLPRLKPQEAGPATATVDVPRPVLKPAHERKVAAANTRDIPVPVLRPEAKVPEQGAPEPDVPLPRLKPQRGAQAPAAVPPARLPGTTKVVVVVPPAIKPVLPGPGETGNGCIASLMAAGVSFEQVSDPGRGACSVRVPVQISGIAAGGSLVQFPDRPVVNCAFALRLADWMKDRGQPIAMQTAGSPIAKFYTGPGFQCRGRNGDNSGKISEHGYGNAVDIERITLHDGRQMWVKDVRSFVSTSKPTLQAMRKSACERFTTVLGPGSNSAHEEHFHFDLGRHGRSGTYVICQ